MRPRLINIRLNNSAVNAPHVVALASQLNISPTLALGHWVRALLWMADEHPDGSLEGFNLHDLARAAGWPSLDAGTFASAFLATCSDGAGSVKDWKMIGQPARRAAAERERVAEHDAAERADRDNWIKPFYDAWAREFGGKLPVEKNARFLKELNAEHGAEEVLRRWCLMLRRASRPEFAGAHLLRQGWGTYAGGANDAMSPRRRRAAAFYEIIKRHGIVTMSGMMDRLAGLEGDGTIKSAERFVELLRRCDRDLLRNARTDAFAIAHIEERLGDALDG